jgi:hypothetical protein
VINYKCNKAKHKRQQAGWTRYVRLCWRRYMPMEIMQLSEHQEKLLQIIDAETKAHQTDQFIYKSEWLGYLPYGLYHWLEIGGKEVKTESPDTLKSDLSELDKFNFINILSVKTEVFEKEDIHIYYEFNRHITSHSSRAKNSWLLLLRRLF